MTYELVDLTSGNFAGVYETEREALRDVALAIAMYGEDDINDLALGFADETGLKGFLIAEGPAFARLASSRFRAVRISANDPQSLEDGEEILLSYRVTPIVETLAHPRESALNQSTVEHIQGSSNGSTSPGSSTLVREKLPQSG